MNSVTSVSQSTSSRSSSENQPQNGPKPSKIASAWPRLVTAPEPHRHFLDVIGHRPEDDEKPDQLNLVLRAGRRVGGDAAGVVVGDHHDDARPRYRQKKPDCLQPAS